jgi:hypothetical protein
MKKRKTKAPKKRSRAKVFIPNLRYVRPPEVIKNAVFKGRIAIICFIAFFIFLMEGLTISKIEEIVFIILTIASFYFCTTYIETFSNTTTANLFYAIIITLPLTICLSFNFKNWWLESQGKNTDAIVLNTEWREIYRRRGSDYYRRYLRIYFVENGKKTAIDIKDPYANTFYLNEQVQLYENPIAVKDTVLIRVAKWRSVYFTKLLGR